MFGWCSWLSRQSNTLKVPGSIPGSNTFSNLKKKNSTIFHVTQGSHYLTSIMFEQSLTRKFFFSFFRSSRKNTNMYRKSKDLNKMITIIWLFEMLDFGYIFEHWSWGNNTNLVFSFDAMVSIFNFNHIYTIVDRNFFFA